MATYVIFSNFRIGSTQLHDYVSTHIKQVNKSFASSAEVFNKYPEVVNAITDYILGWFDEGQIINQVQLQEAFKVAVLDLGIELNNLDSFVPVVQTTQVAKGI